MTALQVLWPVPVAVAAFCTILSVVLTVYDKRIAGKKGRRRVPEKLLLLTAVFGLALPEYVTMRLIRHKTRHNKFMLGLPAIMLLHLLLAAGVWLLFFRQ